MGFLWGNRYYCRFTCTQESWSAISSLIILRAGQDCQGGKKERSASYVHTARSYSKSILESVPHFDWSMMLRAIFYFASYGDVESALCLDNLINKWQTFCRLMLQDSTEEPSSKRERYDYRDGSGPSSGQPPPSYSAQRVSEGTF